MDWPKDINNGENMQEYLLSSAPVSSSPQQYLSSNVSTATHITSLASFSEKVNKRGVSEAMDIDEEDTSRTPRSKI